MLFFSHFYNLIKMRSKYYIYTFRKSYNGKNGKKYIDFIK